MKFSKEVRFVLLAGRVLASRTLQVHLFYGFCRCLVHREDQLRRLMALCEGHHIKLRKSRVENLCHLGVYAYHYGRDISRQIA